jgi:TRAP-type C4-dicarboxylate transport system substrate-binding protein
MEAFGAKYTNLASLPPTAKDLQNADAQVMIYTRLYTILEANPSFIKHVFETNHDLVLSVMLVSDAFHDSLSPRNQRALEKAVMAAARAEREDTVAFEEHMRNELRSKGVSVETLTPENRIAFKALAEPVYEQFRLEFDPTLMSLLEPSLY